jgi:hypothetical protein
MNTNKRTIYNILLTHCLVYVQRLVTTKNVKFRVGGNYRLKSRENENLAKILKRLQK